MCNRYRLHRPLERLAEDFSSIKIPLRFPTGRPNLEPKDYAISDRAPIIRGDDEGARLDMMRWSWPQSPTNRKPVFNFRSEGRKFVPGQRCIIPTDGFYEFTTSADPKVKKKDRWLFTLTQGDLFGIAGIWREKAADGEDAWTMLTTEPGEDVRAIHDRQIVILPMDRWESWLTAYDPSTLLQPSPPGTLKVERG